MHVADGNYTTLGTGTAESNTTEQAESNITELSNTQTPTADKNSSTDALFELINSCLPSSIDFNLSDDYSCGLDINLSALIDLSVLSPLPLPPTLPKAAALPDYKVLYEDVQNIKKGTYNVHV